MSISKFSSVLRIVRPKRHKLEPPTLKIVKNTKPRRTPVIVDTLVPGARECEWCKTPFTPVSRVNRFCSTECRNTAENARRRARTRERLEANAARETEPEVNEVVEEEPEQPAPEKAYYSNSPSVELGPTAACASEDNIHLPWTAVDHDQYQVRQMLMVCIRCPIMNKCAMHAQRNEESGVWGAAVLNMGRQRRWACTACQTINDGNYDICPCGGQSVAFKARATLATRDGHIIYPRRRPFTVSALAR